MSDSEVIADAIFAIEQIRKRAKEYDELGYEAASQELRDWADALEPAIRPTNTPEK